MYRKMMMFLAVMLMVCVSVFGEKKEMKYKVENGQGINAICNKCNVDKDSLLKWNQELVNRNKSKYSNSCNDDYPFRVDDEVVYYVDDKLANEVDWATNKTKGTQPNKNTTSGNIAETTTKEETEGEKTVIDTGDTEESEESSLWFLWLMMGLAGGFVIGKKGFKNLVRNKNTGNYKDVGNAAQIGNLMSQDELEKLRTENERLKKENERLTTDNKKLSAENKNLRQDKKDLLDENVELGEKIDATKSYGYAQSHGADNKSQQQNQHSTSGRLYAMAIIDGCLYRVSETPIEETIFELRQRGESRADVDIYRSAHEKILADVNYLDGCDKQVVGNSPVSVNVESLGEAVKDQDGFWRVTKKPNVIVR